MDRRLMQPHPFGSSLSGMSSSVSTPAPAVRSCSCVDAAEATRGAERAGDPARLGYVRCMGLRIVPGTANPLLAGAIARALSTGLLRCELERFPDTEMRPALGRVLLAYGAEPGTHPVSCGSAFAAVGWASGLDPRVPAPN